MADEPDTDRHRILRPGGTVAISDLAHVDEYVDEYIVHLGRLGVVMCTVDRVPSTFPPQLLLVPTRAGGPRPV